MLASSVTTPGNGLATTQAGVPFKPNVSMTLEEIYTGFRGMMIGRSATVAALYETGMYAGSNLISAGIGGYAVGTAFTHVAQTYMPDWYYGTFVDVVGDAVNWSTNFALQVATFTATNVLQLAGYQISTAATMQVPAAAQQSMQDTGGDFGVTAAWNTYYPNGMPGSCPRGEKCPAIPLQ